MKKKKKKSAVSKSGHVHYPYRNISVYVSMSKLTLEFPHMDIDKYDLKMFEQMLRVRLGLADNEIVNLVWMVKPSFPQSLMIDDDFNKFWELAMTDDKDCICLTLCIQNSDFGDDEFLNVEPPPVTTIHETPKKICKTNKKLVSKEKPKPPWRSPRFQDSSEVKKSHQQGGPSRKLCFVDLLNEVESQGGGNGTITVQSSSQPSQETFNHDYWFNRIGNTSHNATQGSTVDNDGNESEDDDIVHLENESEDECNPVEDPDASAILYSDSKNEIGYAEYVDTYKVPVHNEESSSSEDENGSGAEVEDKNDGGPKVVIDKAGGKPVWQKRYLPDMNNIGEEDDPNIFPEEDEIPVVDPDKMLVKYAFQNKQLFKKHLKRYRVKENKQFKCKKSCSQQVRAHCRFKYINDCKWFFYASRVEGESTFVIRSVNLEHTCVGDPKSLNRSADPDLVKDVVLEKLKHRPGSFIYTKAREYCRRLFND
ncbi:uncharacterized protein LOC113304569 [Papaver somniferum]|uniref:uncharacterized protein LOC113304569 n=1 Tax=Papaver somniferum TaxID=3469 RepID=UPI000E7015AE|nr:uncharacterized protein LOC113304569 [Papaver somniferum]XP_026409495.1 uncharacterized protein LOC113304569 [Papaver somniferum]